MKVFSVGGFSAWWGDDMPPNILGPEYKGTRTIGGGEEAMVRTSVGLAEHGHDVTLYWCGLPGEWRGVKFRGVRDPLSTAILQEKPDVIIGWSTIIPFQFKSEKTLCLLAQQLNDCWCVGNWDLVDCVVSPSKTHADQLAGWGYKTSDGHVRPWTVVHNGLDPELYGSGGRDGDFTVPPDFVRNKEWDPIDGGTPYVRVPTWKDRPLNVGHWSSPDRGLQHLLKVWPEVIKREPQARLHVFYEIDKWLDSGCWRNLNIYGDRARLMRRESLPQAKADPTIIFHGAVTRTVLAKAQLECRVQCYPLDPFQFVEGFGGAVNQGIAAGCHVLLAPHDAFPSLFDGAVTWLPAEPFAMVRALPDAIIKALHTPPPSGAEAARFKFTWERAAAEMNRAIHRDWDCASAEVS